MEVARKSYAPFPYEQVQEQTQPKKKKKPKKSFRLEKAIYSMALIGMLALGLILLLRYASLIELRHSIHTQNRQIEALQMEKQKTQIKLEGVSKSRKIESDALDRLGMKYPTHEDTVYISIDMEQVALLTEQLDRQMGYEAESEEMNEAPQAGPVAKILNKVIGLLKI